MSGLLPNYDIANCPEYKALEKFVSGKKKDLDSALNNFCDPVETKAQSGGQDAEEIIEALLWRAWQSVTALAAKTSDLDHLRRLGAAVATIRDRAHVRSAGEVLKVYDAIVWQDLPVFGLQLREAWNYTATDLSSEEERSAWLNLNVFTAHLVASSRDPGLSMFGLWVIRTAFEEQAETLDNTSISVAALWLSYAGEYLQELSRKGETFDGKVAKPGSRFSDKDWRGFTEERWKMWKQRLREVSGQGLDVHAADIVESCMENIEDL